MIRKNFYLTKEQDDILRSLSEISVSEHLRRAIDEYIARKQTENISSSSSKHGARKTA